MYYEGYEVTSLPEGVFGFIYILDLEDDKGNILSYIGKKQCIKEVKLPALKNGKQRPNSIRKYKNKGGKRVYYDILVKETDWKTYEGSSEFTTDMKIINKRILRWCYSKRELTYQEEKYLFTHNAIEAEDYLNVQIGNRYFRGRLR